MRRIAVINQKGGVGKTTTTVNLGAALAIQGRRVVVVDMDAQANLSLALGVEAPSESPTSYSVLIGTSTFGQAVRATAIPNLSLVPSNLDLSGAELELANAMAREYLLRDALREWDAEHRARHGRSAADYVLFDCPPSLGLLSINALAAAGEVLITLQTEFLALQGMSKLVSVVQLLKKRLNPELVVTGIVPCLYDSRLRLAREVLGEIRRYFKSEVFPHPVRSNVKLAEAPSFGQTIFEYAPDSNGAADYMKLAGEILAREIRDPELAGLPPFNEKVRLAPSTPPAVRTPPPPPPRKHPVIKDTPLQPAVKPITAVAKEAAPSVTTSGAASPASSKVAEASAESPRADSSKAKSPRTESPRAESQKAESPKTVLSTAVSSKVAEASAESPRATSSHLVSSKTVAQSTATSVASNSKPDLPGPKTARPTHPPASTGNTTSAKPANAAKNFASKANSPETPAEREHVIVPPPKRALDAARASPPPKPANLADDMPPLPPDAFEILSHPFHDS